MTLSRFHSSPRSAGSFKTIESNPTSGDEYLNPLERIVLGISIKLQSLVDTGMSFIHVLLPENCTNPNPISNDEGSEESFCDPCPKLAGFILRYVHHPRFVEKRSVVFVQSCWQTNRRPTNRHSRKPELPGEAINTQRSECFGRELIWSLFGSL